jgi:hypothetical protein
MSDGWKPIHENHAIEVMAVVLTFAEPLPDRLFRNILRACEDAAFTAGLKSRHSRSGSVRVTVTPEGMASAVPGGASGLLFNRLFEADDGSPIPGKVAEQLQVDPNSIVYRTWSYVSWGWQLDRMRSIMSEGMKMFSAATSLATLRLEYLDRFQWVLTQGPADVDRLLRRESPYIAPSIFDATDLWHSHTGKFLPSASLTKRLQQVHIDALEGVVGGPVEGENHPVRWVNIVTAREDRIPVVDIDAEVPNPDIFGMLDEFHEELKDLLGSVIRGDVAQRIYLTDV